MKIAIAGTGYVGLITGVCFAEKGYQVICVDTDREKIDRMNGAGYPLIHERDLDILMKRNNSRIWITNDNHMAFCIMFLWRYNSGCSSIIDFKYKC